MAALLLYTAVVADVTVVTVATVDSCGSFVLASAVVLSCSFWGLVFACQRHTLRLVLLALFCNCVFRMRLLAVLPLQQLVDNAVINTSLMYVDVN